MQHISRLTAARAAAETLVASGRIPGVVVAVAMDRQQPEVFAAGTDADGRPLVPDDLFPVASITKLATALAVLRLVDRGLIDLDDPADRFLKRTEPHPGVTIRRLLCHTAGFAIDLNAGESPYEPGLTWDTLGQACLRAQLRHPPGSEVLYSNIGYGVLALVRAFCGHPPGFLSPPLRAAAVANQTDDLPGGFIEPLCWNRCPWGLGPEVRGEKEPHWLPGIAGADSFGHTGASGCLAWAAPGSGVAWAILGARTADSGWLLRHSGAISAALAGG